MKKRNILFAKVQRRIRKLNMFLFDIFTLVITIYDFISMNIYEDENDTIVIHHDGHEIILKRFPKQSTIHFFSNLEEVLNQEGWTSLPEPIIHSFAGSYRFNQVVYDIVILVRKEKSIFTLRNEPGKGFSIKKTPAQEMLADLAQFLALTRNMQPRGYSGIYFPISVTQIAVTQPTIPYHPI